MLNQLDHMRSSYRFVKHWQGKFWQIKDQFAKFCQCFPLSTFYTILFNTFLPVVNITKEFFYLIIYHEIAFVIQITSFQTILRLITLKANCLYILLIIHNILMASQYTQWFRSLFRYSTKHKHILHAWVQQKLHACM